MSGCFCDSFRRTRSYPQIGKHIHFVNSHKTSLPLPQATDSDRLENDELHPLVAMFLFDESDFVLLSKYDGRSFGWNGQIQKL